ncbi:MAG: glycosyltransferase involved in cell wall biosynthesis [Psychroserpens sp.]|jgi:glycosyltransferase involved in cell wall biosynthesis
MVKNGLVTVSTGAPGGIRTVIENYIESNVFSDMKMIWVHSHENSSLFINLLIFVRSLAFVSFYRFNGYKVFHIHMAMKGSFFRKMILLFLVKTFGGKTIIHLHGSEFEKFYMQSSKLVKFLVKLTFENSDLVITLSHSWNDFVKSISNKINSKTIYNYVEPIRKYQTKKGNRSEILFMGAIGKRKGIYDLLVAIKMLPVHIRQKNILKVCGDGDLSEAKRLVHELGIEDQVEFLGWISGDQKVELLNACTVAVLPSYNEGLPMFILEAMSLGKPVISTTVGGIPEAIIHGVSGILVEPGCVNDLSRSLMEIQEPALQKKLGEAGLIQYQRLFSPQVVIPQIKKAIVDLS